MPFGKYTGVTRLSQLSIDADLAMGAHNISLGAGQTVDGVDVGTDLMKKTADSDLAMGAHNISLGAGQTVDGVDVGLELVKTTALSDNLRKSDDTSVSAPASYGKVKELTMPAVYTADGYLRLKFTLNPGASGAIYGKIYKNGVAAGTEKSTNTPSTDMEFTEDGVQFTGGDLIQLYAYRSPGAGGTVKNFRVYGSDSFGNALWS